MGKWVGEFGQALAPSGGRSFEEFSFTTLIPQDYSSFARGAMLGRVHFLQ